MTKILLATSNGVGIGHLTRQAAVAKSLPPGHETTLFSLSLGLPLMKDLGIPGEYCPSYDKPWIDSEEWDDYLAARLIAIVEETGAEVVVFDGVAPYRGIRMAADSLLQVAFVWLRRGMWRQSVDEERLDPARYFDLVIEPGDLAQEADRGPTSRCVDARRVSPLSLIEVVEPLPRAEARRLLGLQPKGHVALVTLGSGRLGDVAGPGRVAAETLLAETDWQIAVTRSPIAMNEVPLEAADRFVEIRDVYPLAKYLSAFDVAVSSAGYNAVHELLPAGLPTLLVANSSTRTDDQRARAHHLAKAGLALAADDDDVEAVRSQLHRLLEHDVRAGLAEAASRTRVLMRGADEAGRGILELVSGFGGRKLPPRRFVSGRIREVLRASKDAVGEEGMNRLRRLVGAAPVEHVEVSLVDSPDTASRVALPLYVTPEPTAPLLQGDAPVEHLLPGSSERYRQRRLELIDRYYDVVGSELERSR